MVKQTTLRQAGGSVTATLPKDMVDRLGMKAGDSVFLVESEHGLLLTPYDPTFKEAMELYRQGARQYQNALHELAQ